MLIILYKLDPIIFIGVKESIPYFSYNWPKVGQDGLPSLNCSLLILGIDLVGN